MVGAKSSGAGTLPQPGVGVWLWANRSGTLRLLLAHGADVTVCSRSALSKTQALFAGARHTDFSGLVQPGDYDLVYNTVPHMIFTKRELQALRRDTVLVDLASFPGGVDTLMAHTLGITVVDGRNLPGRTAPETARCTDRRDCGRND